MQPSLGEILVWETIGTALLVLLGCGVVASVALRESKGHPGTFLAVNIGWAMAVFVGASVAWKSGAHLQPGGNAGNRGRRRHPVVAGAGLRRRATDRRIYRRGGVLRDVQGELRCRTQSRRHPGHLRDRPGRTFVPLEHRHRGRRHVRARVLDPALGVPPASTPATTTRRHCRWATLGWVTPRWRSWCSASAPPSAARPDTPSTPPATSVREWRTRCCRFAGKAAQTGGTPGCQWWAH